MKNRIWVLLVLGLGLVPLSLRAQNDDMYFIPKKKTQPEKTIEKPVQKATEQVEMTTAASQSQKSSLGYTFTRIENEAGSERDVDEYNRRYRFSEVGSDTAYLDEEASALAEDGQWVDGFDGSEEDYEYAKRILVFRSPTVGIPVSSPLYWDLCYGPNSIYWNVYDDGFYAYVFPTAWNYAYYGPWRSGFWWGYSYGYPYWGWGGYWGWSWGWRHPYYPYYHHHYPIYSGGYYRPHPTYRTGRPSLGRTGVINRGTVSGRPVRGTTVRGTGTRTGTTTRGARVSSKTETQPANRSNRVVVPRRNSSSERTNTTISRPVMQRSTPSRVSGGSRGGSRSGGVSRGAR